MSTCTVHAPVYGMLHPGVVTEASRLTPVGTRANRKGPADRRAPKVTKAPVRRPATPITRATDYKLPLTERLAAVVELREIADDAERRVWAEARIAKDGPTLSELGAVLGIQTRQAAWNRSQRSRLGS